MVKKIADSSNKKEPSTRKLSTTKKKLDFDDVLELVGNFGPYQILMYFLLCLPASLPAAWSTFNVVSVIFYENDTYCIVNLWLMYNISDFHSLTPKSRRLHDSKHFERDGLVVVYSTSRE